MSLCPCAPCCMQLNDNNLTKLTINSIKQQPTLCCLCSSYIVTLNHFVNILLLHSPYIEIKLNTNKLLSLHGWNEFIIVICCNFILNDKGFKITVKGYAHFYTNIKMKNLNMFVSLCIWVFSTWFQLLFEYLSQRCLITVWRSFQEVCFIN